MAREWITHTLSIIESSGFNIIQGNVLIPISLLSQVGNLISASVQAIERCEIVPSEGSVRIHLIVNALKRKVRVLIHCAIESFSISDHEAKISIRLLEKPILTNLQGQPLTGTLGMLELIGQSALGSFGIDGILQNVIQNLGGVVSFQNYVFSVDLTKISQLIKILEYPTILGQTRTLLHIKEAQFQPNGLRIQVKVPVESIVRKVIYTARTTIKDKLALVL